MILTVPLNALVANKIKHLQTKQMARKDERVNLMSEILAGIKVSNVLKNTLKKY